MNWSQMVNLLAVSPKEGIRWGTPMVGTFQDIGMNQRRIGDRYVAGRLVVYHNYCDIYQMARTEGYGVAVKSW